MYQKEPSVDLLTEEFIPVYGTFGQRFLALLVDTVIVMIPELLLKAMLPSYGYMIGVFILQWLYFAIMESGTTQATFGKRAMGLKVTNLEGEKISFAQATGRYFGKFISSIILLIGYLMMLWDDKK